MARHHDHDAGSHGASRSDADTAGDPGARRISGPGAGRSDAGRISDPGGGLTGGSAGEDSLAAAGGAGRLSLGARLRQARQAQRRTLADVAEASGLTKGFVSKLENDQVNASVASLVRLCDTLGTPVGSLFEPAAGSVVRASAYPPIEFGGEHMQEYVLTPQSERRVQALVSEIEPGGGSGPGHYRLPTEVEFAFVLRGRLEIDLADLGGTASETVVLETGDAFTFPADNRHVFRAPDGPTRVLWVFSPALPGANTWREDDGSREAGQADGGGSAPTAHGGSAPAGDGGTERRNG